MKKLLATAATLLLAFGSVALSTNIATADEAPPVEVVTETTAADDTTTTTAEEPAATQEEPAATEEPPATEEQPPATEEQPPALEVAEVSENEIAAEPEITTGTDPPVETASRMATESFETLDVAFVGVVGELKPWSAATNDPDYWETYTDHKMECYKHGGNSDHGSITDDGKTVTLKTFNQDWYGDHWELLVVKGGNVWNNVIVHPTAGVAYASTENAGGNQSDVSHWIVCKGVTPDTPKVASADVQTTPGTCEAPGTVAGINPVNATFGAPTYLNGQYTLVATATGGAKFPAGPGVSDDGTTKTFTGPVPPQNIELCNVASAEVKTTPGTCEADGTVVGINAVNATFGDPVYENGMYTIVATATGSAKFAAGAGVNDARTTKTFTGEVPKQNTELCTGEVTFCHAHPADTAANGWELMSNMPVQSVNGHKQHAADIIPPVPGILPAGLNWDKSFMVNGVELTAQEILRLGCDFKIEVPIDPGASDEYCYDGEAQDGSITVYFGDLGDKIQYRITGGDGVNILIEDGDATTVDLPAGDYTVTAEAVAPYEIKGEDEWELTIDPAINCVCVVDSVDKIDALSIVDPECAEAEVSVKPATCEAAASLVLGSTLHATFGEPVIENGTYTVVATADEGYRFYPGEGVSENGFEKTFEGTLAPKATACGDLTTLSLPNTGGGIADGALWLGVFAIGLGVTGVIVATRRATAKR